MLLGIHEEKWKFACRLFQCLAISFRPLRVDELAEIMAVRFDGEARPHFNTGWQLENAEEAVLSACSSLITIANTNGSRIVQFSHFSVKEFLTSERLATVSENISRYHIVSRVAHTTLTQASLGVLLQLNNHTDKESIRNFPLADYAARHWITHCQFGNLSSAVQDATKCLFDREKPHFSAWVWIHDIDDPWQESMPTKRPERPEATPFYYATLCDFLWLMEHLIVTYPGDVNARGGYFETPLLEAVRKEDVNLALSPSPNQHSASAHVLSNGDMHGASPSKRIDIVRLLLQHNADIELPNEEGETPLYWAAAIGELDISQLLLESGADVHSRNKNGWTPLRVASHNGCLDLVRLLINSGADVDSHDNDGWVPLHSTSRRGQVDILKLLIRSGADVNRQAKDRTTPLYLASSSGELEILRLLVQQGAGVQFQDKDGWTPLKAASYYGYIDVVRFLIDSGADLDPQDKDGWTALHSASRQGHINIVEFLVQRGADVNKQAVMAKRPRCILRR
jgi:ankyrin repeat protein